MDLVEWQAHVESAVQSVIRATKRYPQLHEHLLRVPRLSSGNCSPLVWSVCGAEGGTIADTIHLSAALELWWMGAEALDDVFDEAPAKGSNAGPGLTGVIATLQSLPALVLSRANLPHPLRCSVIEEFAEASLSACEGQIRDMTSDISRIDVHDVLRIYRGKTGAFWVAAARMSAKVACADADAVYQWGRFAEHVGVIRQLYNDRSDLLEGRDEDIRNGTPTIMLAHALSLHREEGRERLLDHVRAAGVDTEARSRVRGMLTSAEVVREHLAYTRALKARGRALLDAIKPTEPYASTLYEMVD